MPTKVFDYRALLKGSYWFPIPPGGSPLVATPQPVVLTYSFAQTASAWIAASSPATAATFRAFSAADEAVARTELQQWAQVSGITFLETTASEGDITFGFYNLLTMGYPGSVGLGNYPSAGAALSDTGALEVYSYQQAAAGDVYVDTSYVDAPDPPSDLAHVLIHEIGHALGLKHPFDNGAFTLDPSLDNGSETVMSYTGARLDVPGPLDVAAVQSIYGVHGATPASWTWSWDAADEIYTVHSTGDAQFVRGVGARSDVVYAPGLHDAVVTAQGDDVIYTAGQAISINAGAGYDTVYTGLAYAGLTWGVRGSGDYRYVAVTGGLQEYNDVETLAFSDGVYSTVTSSFTPLAPLTVAAEDPALAEGGGPFVFDVSRSDATVSRLVDWAVLGSGNAPADAADFAGGVLPSGQVSFAAGQMQQTVTVAVNNDALLEADEQFTLQLSDPTSLVAEGSAAATIVNDDATVAISGTGLQHDEGASGNTAFSFTLTRSGLTLAGQTVSWRVSGQSPNAASAADFAGGVLPSGTVTFAVGETSRVVSFNVAGDTDVEPDEGFLVSLSNPCAGLTISTATAAGTIQNDDASVSIAAASASRAEGDTGGTPFTFTVTRSGDLSVVASVGWAVAGSGGTAADAADFVGGALPSGAVSFAAGVASQTITVAVAGDTVVEPEEGFSVTLSGAATGDPSHSLTIGTAAADGTILNDDVMAASLAIAATDANKAEGNSGATAFTFTVTRSGNLAAASSATWQVIGGVANSANPADFTGGTAPSGAVSFAAGESSQTITVCVAGDTLAEADEQFRVQLGHSVGATIATGSATATILNDDTSLSIAATDASKAEGNAGATPFVFTVTRSGVLSGISSVGWQVTGAAPNSANPADFVGGVVPSGTLSFAAGEVSRTLTVNVAGDTVAEPDEHFRLALGHSVGATLAIVDATATILNDDTNLSIAASDAHKAEGNSGSTPFIFTVTRSGTLSGVSSATWQVSGAATNSANPADFAGGVVPSGAVSFAAGETSKTITVEVAGDTVNEADEQFLVVLGHSVGATLAAFTATGTILNDDTPAASLSIAATDANKAEGNSGATPFTFTVTRAGALTGVSTATWQVSGAASNSANPADFVGGVVPSGTVSFAAGVASQTITVNVAGDTTNEADEQFKVVLGHSVGATLATYSATATILNDDGGAGGGGLGGSGGSGGGGGAGGNLSAADLVASTTPVAHADFNGDGTADVLRQAPGGDLYVLDGASLVQSAVSQSAAGLTFVAAADFNGDGRGDLLLQGPPLQGNGGALYDWTMAGASVVRSDLVAVLSNGQTVAEVRDYTGDGRADILLANGGAGGWTLLEMHGGVVAGSANLASLPEAWQAT